MKRFFRLYQREFSLRAWQSWLLGGAALTIQPLMVILAKFWHGERFEAVYHRSAAPAAVVILTALAVGWMVYSVLRDFRGGMDTLLTLPHRREWSYLAKLAAFGSIWAVLFAGLLGGLLLSYGFYLQEALPYQDSIPWPLDNGLILALCRSDVLRLLFPLEGWGAASNLLLLAFLTVESCYAGYAIQAKRFWCLLPLAAGGICWVQVFQLRLGYAEGGLPGLWWHLGVLAAAAWAIGHSLWMIRRADF